MGWVEATNLIALGLGLLLVVESFRREPFWWRPKGASPRERRWLGAGLALAMTGLLISMNLEGDTPLRWLSFALIVLGLAAIVTGIVRGPTVQERERRERMMSQDAG